MKESQPQKRWFEMIVENPYQYYREYYRIEDSKVEVRQLFMSLSYMFFYKHIFWRSGSDMLSQNLEGGSKYASDMLILVSWGWKLA